MELLSLLTESAFLTGIAAILGSVITFLITKSNNKKDMSINDRMQLSKDQYQLIAELRQMMQEQKEEIDNFRDEIKQLQAVNMSLIVENKELQSKITALNVRLTNMGNR